MRYSTDEDDVVGFQNWERDCFNKDGAFAIVFLDDVEQHQVEMADDEEGVVRRYVLDAEGNVQIDPNDPAKNSILRETVRGKVRIELRSERKGHGGKT